MPGTQQPARLLAESRGTESKNLLHGTALVFLWHRIHRRTREESKFSQLPLFFFPHCRVHEVLACVAGTIGWISIS